MPDETKLADVLAFLQGEAALEGVHFGERHPTERGAFWWRKHLRAAVLADRAARSEQEDWLTLICKHAAFNAGKEGAAPEELPKIVAALHARAETADVPEGWLLMPAKLTEPMRVAMRTGCRKDWPSAELCNVRYAAMIHAAPTQERGADDE